MSSANTIYGGHLPRDCTTHVLSHLTMRDSLVFGSSSKSSLSETLPDLFRRRRKLTERYCLYQSEIYCTNEPKVSGTNEMNGFLGNGSIMTCSVLERLKCLHKFLPSCHPHKKHVRDIIADLNKTNHYHATATSVSIITNASPNLMKQDDDNYFFEIFNELRNITKAHKTHATMLRNIIYSNPSKSQNMNQKDSPLTLTVPLSNYVGDVLIAYYLICNSISKIVEGSPTELDWMRNILQELQSEANESNLLSPFSVQEETAREQVQEADSICASCWYRAWVFLHSTVLRTAPFTTKQMFDLGIGPDPKSLPRINYFEDKRKEIDSTFSDSILLPPINMFVGVEKKQIMSFFANLPHFESLKITFNDFGSLGPTFRGRDRIRTEIISPMRPISAIVAFDMFPFHKMDMTNNIYLNHWRDGRNSEITWLLEVHKEVRKSRPMTVCPPLLSINCVK